MKLWEERLHEVFSHHDSVALGIFLKFYIHVLVHMHHGTLHSWPCSCSWVCKVKVKVKKKELKFFYLLIDIIER